jgi:16S rRNA (guanine527-N7)-methyltransferase
VQPTFNKDSFHEIFNVSRETLNKLSRFQEVLEDNNKKFNIIGKSTLDNIWQRHFADSAKLYSILESIINNRGERGQKICDVGTGGGFPGMVLAIMSIERDLDISFTLVESSKKKCSFLEKSSQYLEIPIEVVNQRVEDFNKKFDVILARAVAPLPELLNNCSKISKSSTTYIFPKGKNFESELSQLKKKWYYAINIVKNNISIDKSGGVTLVLSDVKKIK